MDVDPTNQLVENKTRFKRLTDTVDQYLQDMNRTFRFGLADELAIAYKLKALEKRLDVGAKQHETSILNPHWARFG